MAQKQKAGLLPDLSQSFAPAASTSVVCGAKMTNIKLPEGYRQSFFRTGGPERSHS